MRSAVPGTPDPAGSAREVHEAYASSDLKRWILEITNNTDVTGTVTVSGATLEMRSRDGSAGSRSFDLRQVLAAVVMSELTWNNRSTANAWTSPGASGTAGELAPSVVATATFSGPVDITSTFTGASLDALLTTFLNAGTGAKLLLMMSRNPLLANDTLFNEFCGVADTANGPMLTIPYSAGGGGSPTISTVSSNSANEGSPIVHTVTLSGATAGIENYAASLAGGTATGGGTDYTSALASLTYSAGVTVSGGNLVVPSGVSSFTVTVPTASDIIVEGSETYTLTVGGTAGTGTILNVALFSPKSIRRHTGNRMIYG